MAGGGERRGGARRNGRQKGERVWLDGPARQILQKWHARLIHGWEGDESDVLRQMDALLEAQERRAGAAPSAPPAPAAPLPPTPPGASPQALPPRPPRRIGVGPR